MEIKIRYTFKRKSDGYIVQEIWPIEALEKFSNRPFVFQTKEGMQLLTPDWEVVGRDLWTGEVGFEGDIAEVCVFLVSPENPDNDQHFRGLIYFDTGTFVFKIYHYLKFDGSKSEWIDIEPKYLPFYEPEMEDDGTFTIPYFQFMGISGNLGEFNPDDVKIVGDIYTTPELIQK